MVELVETTTGLFPHSGRFDRLNDRVSSAGFLVVEPVVAALVEASKPPSVFSMLPSTSSGRAFEPAGK